MLWKRNKPHRHFAQIDERGHCQAFWSLTQPPVAGAWIEVNETNPYWIGRPLTGNAATQHASELTASR